MLRLKSAADFERVRRDGRSHAHPLVVLVANRRPEAVRPGRQAREDGELATRIGFAAGRGIGTAVQRNRAKRLLREAIRACTREIAPGWDLVLIARPPLADASLPQAQAAVRNLLRHANVVSADPQHA